MRWQTNKETRRTHQEHVQRFERRVVLQRIRNVMERIKKNSTAFSFNSFQCSETLDTCRNSPRPIMTITVMPVAA